MKKFLLGLLCGGVLSFSTAAFASNTIQAYLFPTKVTVYSSAGIKTIDGTGSNAVLNYNNKAYIPLRTFTDAMGAKLEYQPASAANGNKHQIKIFDSNLQTALKWKDKDGYVSLGQFVWKNEEYNRSLQGGTIQINKDMTGKQIDLIVKDAKGRITGSSDWVYIDGETRTPKAGEIRTFRAQTNIVQDQASSIEVVVHDLLQPVQIQKTPPEEKSGPDVFDRQPFYLSVAPNSPPGGQLTYPLGQIVSYHCDWIYTSSDNIVLDPTLLEITVYRVVAPGQSQEILKQTLTIQGKLASGSGYQVNYMWDQKDSKGKQVPSGEYSISMKLPDRIAYLNARTKQKEQWKTEYIHFSRVGFTIK